jgi:hypothetical protein
MVAVIAIRTATIFVFIVFHLHPGSIAIKKVHDVIEPAKPDGFKSDYGGILAGNLQRPFLFRRKCLFILIENGNYSSFLFAGYIFNLLPHHRFKCSGVI